MSISESWRYGQVAQINAAIKSWIASSWFSRPILFSQPCRGRMNYTVRRMKYHMTYYKSRIFHFFHSLVWLTNRLVLFDQLLILATIRLTWDVVNALITGPLVPPCRSSNDSDNPMAINSTGLLVHWNNIDGGFERQRLAFKVIRVEQACHFLIGRSSNAFQELSATGKQWLMLESRSPASAGLTEMLRQLVHRSKSRARNPSFRPCHEQRCFSSNMGVCFVPIRGDLVTSRRSWGVKLLSRAP